MIFHRKNVPQKKVVQMARQHVDCGRDAYDSSVWPVPGARLDAPRCPLVDQPKDSERRGLHQVLLAESTVSAGFLAPPQLASGLEPDPASVFLTACCSPEAALGFLGSGRLLFLSLNLQEGKFGERCDVRGSWWSALMALQGLHTFSDLT